MSKSLLDLVSITEDKRERHDYLMDIVNQTGAELARAIFDVGEMYSEFVGTQRECSEFYNVDETTVNQYLTIIQNVNLDKISNLDEISKNKLLTTARKNKAEQEGQMEDFELTFDAVLGNTNKVDAKPETIDAIKQLVEDAKDESPEVKTALMGKGGGLATAQTVISSDMSDTKKIQALKMSKKKLEVFMGVTEPDKPEPKNIAEAKDRNKTLTEENAELRARNKELEKKLADFDASEDLLETMRAVMSFMNQIIHADDIKADIKKRIVGVSGLEEALRRMHLSTMELPSIKDAKRNYKDMAKKHHPDAGGDNKEFLVIKDAYELILKTIKGK